MSVNGMDPAFANILQKTSTSSPHSTSQLGQSITARHSTRKSRGGMAYQELRPSSLVGQPEVLAAELGAVTIPFSYAYHNRTDPTFSLQTLDVTMTSL